MCGIIGVIGHRASDNAFSGLKALEYRGYDSWGIAATGKGKFEFERHVGKIGEAKLSISPNTEVAIGHTRWATHGRVSEANAHPHLSMDGSVAIVHNGIVENFDELKEGLLKKGFVFRSDTDSEVIANLIQDNLLGTGKTKVLFEEAVRLSLLRIEGYFAIAAIRLGEEKIVCARYGSPLVLGIAGNGKSFVASDVTAFLWHTKMAVFLEDFTMAVLEKGSLPRLVEVGTGKTLEAKIVTVSWSVEQANKGDYAHFMLKEIFEQRETILKAIEQPRELIIKIASEISAAKKIIFLGCGSSYHACVAGTYLFAENGLDSRAMLASEANYFPRYIDKDALVIAISQSGETADLFDAVKFAKGHCSKIIAIVNVMDSTIMRLADYPIMMNAGPEISVLSTKSYTSQLAVVLSLADAASAKARNFDRAKGTLLEAATWLTKNIMGINRQMKSLAKKLANSKDIFVIGRGVTFPTALESALKIKEVSYIHAEGFAGGELKHGTIALIEEGTPAIVLVTPETKNLILSNAIEVKSRGALIIGIDSENSEVYDIHIKIPQFNNATPLLQIIPLQFLSYYLALNRGLDPDKPRNLSKVVTVR